MNRSVVLWVAAAALFAGCAGGARPVTTSDVRAQLPALEARVQAAPADAAALRELGRAYARLGSFDQAEEVLLRAERAAPGNAETVYALGLVNEAQNRPAQALVRYRTAGGAAGPYAGLAAGRRVRLETQAERTEVDSLLDAERYPAVRTGVVAVLPFRYQGPPALRPLARGLTALLADDLGALGLSVVGAGRVQSLFDALSLAPDAVGDDRARRLAHLLQADHVVVGTLDARGDAARAEAALWDWVTSVAPRPVEATGEVDDLFALESELVETLAARAGVELSESQRARIAQRPTGSAEAFLQYSRGLVEEDAGRFAEASALYAEAARLDPGFRLAADRAATSQTLETASSSVQAALAAADRLGPSVAATRLVGRRLTNVNQTLGVHTPAVDGERVPTAEVPLAPPSAPLPLPPPPPSSGGTQTPR